MAYELRLAGQAPTQFDTEPEAVAAARAAIQANADAEPEIFDLTTGRACAPGGSKAWREELKNKVGF